MNPSLTTWIRCSVGVEIPSERQRRACRGLVQSMFSLTADPFALLVSARFRCGFNSDITIGISARAVLEKSFQDGGENQRFASARRVQRCTQQVVTALRQFTPYRRPQVTFPHAVAPLSAKSRVKIFVFKQTDHRCSEFVRFVR